MKDVVLTISEVDKNNLLYALGMAADVCSKRKKQAVVAGINAVIAKIMQQLEEQSE